MTKVTFIWHDCFTVETPSANFIFDYWLDSNGANNPEPGFLDSLSPDKPLYVLVSHSHKDHFNTAIFGWASRFNNIHYIISKDVGKRIRHILSPTSVYSGPKVEAGKVTVLRPGERFEAEGVRIAAFPSTDVGNSYIAEVDGQRIFHAGDLNAWIWLDESTPAEIKKAMGDYNACLRDIESYLILQQRQTIDFCFFPVDSRIGRDYPTGARIFVRKFDVGRFFAMHFDLGDEDERLKRCREALNFNIYANTERGEYIPLAVNGSYYISS